MVHIPAKIVQIEQDVRTPLRDIIAHGMKRVRSDIAELKARGLMDENGKLLHTETPPDMRNDDERDFGG